MKGTQSEFVNIKYLFFPSYKIDRSTLKKNAFFPVFLPIFRHHFKLKKIITYRRKLKNISKFFEISIKISEDDFSCLKQTVFYSQENYFFPSSQKQQNLQKNVFLQSFLGL